MTAPLADATVPDATGPAAPGSPAPAGRYQLEARERRRRARPWWVLALVAALLVAAFTFAAREVRDVGARSASAGGSVVIDA